MDLLTVLKYAENVDNKLVYFLVLIIVVFAAIRKVYTSEWAVTSKENMAQLKTMNEILTAKIVSIEAENTALKGQLVERDVTIKGLLDTSHDRDV